MKRPPAYQLHKATGQACVKIAGRFHYLGKYGTPESKERYAQVIGGKEEPPIPVVPLSITVGTMLSAFLARNDAEYAATSSEPRQFPFAILPLLRMFGGVRVADFQAHHLDAVRKAMASGSWLTDKERAAYAKRKQSTTLCREVINRRVARIKLAFKRAELWQLIPAGTFARLAVITGANTKARHAPEIVPARWRDILSVVRRLTRPGKRQHKERGRRLASMLLLQWWTGARPGEIRIMRPMDIDRSEAIWIYKPGSEEEFGKHKNAWRGQSRDIPLGPKCQAILKQALGGDSAAFFFPSKRGAGAYSESGYTNAIRRAARAVGVQLHPYMIRHGSKRRVENEHGPAGAKAFLGQESMDSTRKYAKQQDLELAKKIAGKAG